MQQVYTFERAQLLNAKAQVPSIQAKGCMFYNCECVTRLVMTTPPSWREKAIAYYYYIITTGETHSVQQFANNAFLCVYLFEMNVDLSFLLAKSWMNSSAVLKWSCTVRCLRTACQTDVKKTRCSSRKRLTTRQTGVSIHRSQAHTSMHRRLLHMTKRSSSDMKDYQFRPENTICI